MTTTQLTNVIAFSENTVDEISTKNSHINFVNKMYAWMSFGILLTTITALFTSLTSFIEVLYNIPLVIVSALLLQIVLTVGISILNKKLNTFLTFFTFVFYSIVTGLTISLVFYSFTTTSIILTFFATAGMFGIMSLYGHLSNEDLMKFNNLALMGLLGIIFGSVLNIFLNNNMTDWLFTYIGIGLFLILIAYSSKSIKTEGQNSKKKIGVSGALNLYTNFVAMFIFFIKQALNNTQKNN